MQNVSMTNYKNVILIDSQILIIESQLVDVFFAQERETNENFTMSSLAISLLADIRAAKVVANIPKNYLLF